MRLLWLTDIHLGHLYKDGQTSFLSEVKAQDADAVLIGGDIAEAPTIVSMLEEIADHLGCRTYFVLGNHDFYRDSIADTRSRVSKVCARISNLNWLSEMKPVSLSSSTALIGHDGWYDCRWGDFWNSPLMLSDFFLIREFNSLLGSNESDRQTLRARLISNEAKQARLEMCRKLADEAAEHIASVLTEALQSHDEVILLTHVPPFKEASWHLSKHTDDFGLPFFSSKVMGDTILDIMGDYPERQLTVLCGHTHTDVKVQIRPNIKSMTGRAEYQAPHIQMVWEIE